MSEVLPEISVIVPIYNSEKYLCKCIDSILDQTFKDFELLLIDDGSTDQSSKICDEYAQKDTRIRVFHKHNGGVASARQMGIDNMSGEYCIQVDSDDWIEPEMLKSMYETALANNSDMVVCDFVIERQKPLKSWVSQQGPIPDNSTDILNDMIINKMASLGNKLIKATCYTSPVIVSYEPGLNVNEDLVCICKLLVHPRRVSYLPMTLYHYVQYNNPYSYMHGKHLFEKRVVADNIIYDILVGDEYANGRLYCKIVEASLALKENALTKREFITRYSGLRKKQNYDKYIKRYPFLKIALKGHYLTSRFLLCSKEVLKIFYVSIYRVIFMHRN